MFVDASGRRGRTLRRFGWAVTIVCACYATTVAASLVGGDSGAPFLRIPGVTEGKAEAVEAEGAEAEAVAEAERPTREPAFPNGTVPSDRGRVAGVVPPSATADIGEPVGRVAPVAESGVSDERDEEGGTVADTAPTQPAPGTTPPAGGSAGTPPADPQNETGTGDEADPPADEPAGNGNPVDGLLGGLLGLPPLLGG
ncbi:hypothetical protein [Streptomyces sp. NPDC058155]|uniref:hypothetical protein n=1 Tax=Streptomyces sp. NPDC058155 TaxID=3346359 RepID=UPI0036E577ED